MSREVLIFPVQLTTSRIGNLTRLILTLAKYDDHTYVAYPRIGILYVCMYCHAYSKSMDQPGKVPNPPRGQLNREKYVCPVRVRACEFGLASRVRSVVPSRVSRVLFAGCMRVQRTP